MDISKYIVKSLKTHIDLIITFVPQIIWALCQIVGATKKMIKKFDKVDAKMHWLFYCFLNFISKSLFIIFFVIVIDFLNDLTFF